MENKLPKRKPTRLRNFDYSSTGAYFVTICTGGRKPILSKVVRIAAKTQQTPVGEGLAPPAHGINDLPKSALAPPTPSIFTYQTQLTLCGNVAEEQLKLLEKRYSCVTIKDYVIMPDHIHACVTLRKETGGASPSPTLNDVICAFKSLTSRICKQKYGIENMFQRSYEEHIVRDMEDYETRRKYIYENPMRWYYNKTNLQ